MIFGQRFLIENIEDGIIEKLIFQRLQQVSFNEDAPSAK